jgi:hypothetical protein
VEPGQLNDADLLGALNEAQRSVAAARDQMTARAEAWERVVALTRELERRYPPAPVPGEAGTSEDRVASRASSLLPEERAVGGGEAEGLAEAVLADSDQRSADREAAPDSFVEHRTSGEATPPPQ